MTPIPGTQTNTFTAWGELKSTVDQNGQTTTFSYDQIGRVTNRVSPEETVTYSWDPTISGAGQLGSTSSTNGISSAFQYDTIGRLTNKALQTSSGTYTYGLQYDTGNLNQLTKLTYPTVPGVSTPYSTSYSYTSEGDLSLISDSTSLSLYSVTDWTAAGQVASETFGNGVVSTRRYDKLNQVRFIDTSKTVPSPPQFIIPPILVQKLAYQYLPDGLLQSQHDLLANSSEFFGYDEFSRLLTWGVTQNCGQSVIGYGYDDGGNTLSRTVNSGVGVPMSMTYGTTTSQPHAVKSLTVNGQTTSYGYDQVGNQRSSGGRVVTYTSFGLPKSIVTSQGSVSFAYDANHQRTIKTTPSEVTTYLDGIYERRAISSQITHAFFVSAGGRVIAQKEVVEGGAVADKLTYLHSDRLGSIESLTDTTGNVLEHRKYDPFGRRANPNSLTLAASLTHGSTRIGFIGDEPDDENGLMNLKGRMYDPSIGRFLSPDPVVHVGSGGQRLNRYSYGFNSPHNFPDPSGLDGLLGDLPEDTGPRIHTVTPPTVGFHTEIYGHPDGYSNAGRWVGGDVSSVDRNGPKAGTGAGIGSAISSLGTAYVNLMAGELEEFGEVVSAPIKGAAQLVLHPGDVISAATSTFSAAYKHGGLLEAANVINPMVAVYDHGFQAYDAWHAGDYNAKVGRDYRAFGKESLATVVSGVGVVMLASGAARGVLKAVGSFGKTAEVAAAAEVGATECIGGVCPCFVAGTLVATEFGKRPIESIQVGDLVFAEDPVSGDSALEPVVKKFITPDKETVLVQVNQQGIIELIESTPNHPYWVVGRGWTPAKSLKKGDSLLNKANTSSLVETVRVTGRSKTVYNLEVSHLHTYFVGPSANLVHNSCGIDFDKLEAVGGFKNARIFARAADAVANQPLNVSSRIRWIVDADAVKTATSEIIPNADFLGAVLGDGSHAIIGGKGFGIANIANQSRVVQIVNGVVVHDFGALR